MRAKEVNFSGLTIRNLRLMRLIGQGNWADVYLAQDIHTFQKAAVKVTPQKKLMEVSKLQELMQAEISILKQCHNNNVIRLLDDFQHADHQFIVLEYCDGFELGDILRRERKLEEPIAVNYLKQILNGFKGLHEVRAMHRDFKAENVMLHEGVCKIVDLGFGKQLTGEEVARTKLGSNLTMAPEVMQGLPYDFRADIWSIGVVFFQMLFGRFPIFARSPTTQLEKARNSEYTFDGAEVSDQSKDFLSRCLKFNPEQRINWVQIYHHPLIADANHQVVVGPPSSRINVQENQQFYLSISRQLQKEVVPPEAVRSSIIHPSIEHYQQPRQAKQQPQLRPKNEPSEVFEKQKTQIFLSVIQEQSEKNEPSYSQKDMLFELARRNEQLSEEILKEQAKKVIIAIRNIKYLYMTQLNNIEFVSQYILATMRETDRKCQINHTPIICLLLKDAYLRLDKLDDEVNFGTNTFKVDEAEFKYFLDDQEVPKMIKQRLRECKQAFEEYQGFLDEEDLKDDRLRRALQNIKCRENLPNQLLDEYLCTHAKTLANSDLSDNWGVYCKLLKLAFCLKKYSQHKDHNFSRKRILAKLNHFNCEQAYFTQLNRASRSQAPNQNRPFYLKHSRSIKCKIFSPILSLFGFN